MKRYVLIGFASLACGMPDAGFDDPVTGQEAEAESEGEVIEQGPMEPPQLGRVPATWQWEYLPIRGFAQAGAIVLINGGADSGGIVENSSTADGTFCANVRLRIGAENTLQIQAQSADGQSLSATTTVSVVQTGEPPEVGQDDPEVPQATNVAARSPYAAAKAGQPISGGIWDPADGAASSYARFDVDDLEISTSCNNFVWYTVGFDEAQTIESIVVRWGDEYGQQYRVMVSEEAAPAFPNPSSPDWTEVGRFGCGEPNSDGGVDDVPISGPVNVRWAAILMYENQNSGTAEHFKLAEFELWSPPEPSVGGGSNLEAPTCENGLPL